MTDIIADFIAQGVDMIISAVIISAIITCMSSSRDLNVRINEQQAIHAEITEYRQHNQFDDTTVYAQDIISAVMKYRGTPFVRVKIGSDVYTWSTSVDETGTTNSSPYSVSAIGNLISPDYTYKASLVKDANGVVIGYEFIKNP